MRKIFLVLLAAAAMKDVAAQSIDSATQILVMPPDIRYYTVSAGGIFRPQEAWTDSAVRYFSNALTELSVDSGIGLNVSVPAKFDKDIQAHQALFGAVGQAVTEHHVRGRQLPSGKGRDVSDWTLGPGLRTVFSETGVKLGLFIHYREHQSAGGRIAFAILAGAANAQVPTQDAHGYASLVDLQSGELRWFELLSDEGVDLYDPAGAKEMARRLIDALPISAP